MAVSERSWSIRQGEPRAREQLSRALGVSELLASILLARGLDDPTAARSFLKPSLATLPDPLGIPGMAAAVERLARAVRAGETVWVYTDYDVDGVTSAALLTRYLQDLGVQCRARLPRRDREGYGLHPLALEEIAAAGGRLVVTADCGITALEPARRALELGLELLITDHHTPGEVLPEALAVVNPKLPGGDYPDDAIAGVGVAWNLAAALRGELRRTGYFRDRPEPDVRDYLGLVALGTVADVVPLRRVNRVLVAGGLARLNRAPGAGVQALREVAGVRGALKAGHIGFQLGPRLNAAGRMADPREALELLVTDDTGRARSMAAVLDDLNRERQAEERALFDTAVARVTDSGCWPAAWSLVVEGADWHRGVIGIVASRLVERFHRPTVVLGVEADDTARGSARSIPGLDLYAALSCCAPLLRRFGGHAAAAGLELDAGNIDAFREEFEAAVRAALREEDLVPLVRADAEVQLDDVTLETVRELEAMQPFGPGNPTPALVACGLRVADLRTLGREKTHLKLVLEQGETALEALGWRRAAAWPWLTRGQRVDAVFAAQVRRWNGVDRVQLTLEDLRPA